MSNAQLTQYLVGGAINGTILAALAFAAPRFTRQILFGFLVFAALMYTVFTVGAADTPTWLMLELLGLVIYGAVGYRGLKGSMWWLAAGWALHPLWDVALHYFGPGRPFAPVDYTIPCLTYDIAVAAFIAFRQAADRKLTTVEAR